MFSLGRPAGTMTATIAIKAKATEIKRTVAARLGAMPLSDFLAACRSRLWAVVLAEDQRLVGVKRARACGAEDHRDGLNAVAFGRSREGEFVAVPFAGGQIRRNQIRRRGIVDSAGRRSQFSERPGVSSELGIVLHLRGVEGLKRLESSRLLGVHPRSVHVALSQGGAEIEERGDSYNCKQSNRTPAHGAPPPGLLSGVACLGCGRPPGLFGVAPCLGGGRPVFLAVGGGRLVAVFLANGQRLIGEERTRAGGTEHRRHRRNRVEIGRASCRER